MEAYDTIENGNLYFQNKLHSLVWSSATESEKTKALLEATLRINNLRFAGYKVDEDQENEFPRYYGDEPDGTETTPDKIKWACFEVAYSLLDDVDVELEIQNLTVLSHGYSSVRSSYDRSVIPNYLAAGIPNILAWQFLLPYLASSRDIKINRTS